MTGRAPNLRLVETSRRREVPRLSVQFTIHDGRTHFGRSRAFQLREDDIAALLIALERLDRRASA
jgi:hypothetical protein